MSLPVSGRDLVGDQLVDGLGVGHPQERLRQAHQDHALAARQLELVHEGVDPALTVAAAPDLLDQVARPRGDPVQGVVRHPGLAQEALDDLALIRPIVGPDLGPQRVDRR